MDLNVFSIFKIAHDITDNYAKLSFFSFFALTLAALNILQNGLMINIQRLSKIYIYIYNIYIGCVCTVHPVLWLRG